MPTFRKKPVVVEAHEWWKNGDHPLDESRTAGATWREDDPEGKLVRRFASPERPSTSRCEKCKKIMAVHGWIDTLEGGHIVCPGDFIITGVAGEHYPCKPSIFAATYEPVE